MKITWFGTASILLESEGEKLLFDPFVQLAGGSNPNSLEDFPANTDICITHGHVDHLFFLPDLLAEQDITVYGTKAVMDTLEGWVEETGSLVQAEPGCSWHRGNMKITILKGQHTRFTARMVLRKLINPRLFRYFRNTLFLAWAHPQFPEKGETVAYQIDAEGKRILLLGSMALDKNTIYPTNVDLLILPFQGRENMAEAAMEIVDELKPRRILLDHFDDAFPPVSEDVDTRPFKRAIALKHPEIKVVKPRAGKPVAV
ncbi:MBL fold metallo-hydrolase [Eisenbergiella tayi]|uniref:MBL fold metallo-hydrolase n=1 Tax=Eisenbergiella tayi TaxID=1432052 RepID=UPI0008483B25|nr:MBL fold metallo-hydrolase [Eisenbergiella tayi]ODR37157.1 hypothetical protein BEI60_10635 [Eisenbergiella tayi]